MTAAKQATECRTAHPAALNQQSADLYVPITGGQTTTRYVIPVRHCVNVGVLGIVGDFVCCFLLRASHL